ncbi:MAG TPA: YHYH protein [Rickettsiales bacterium]|nr:YHYH protein [Rickettsiales bacterium]
MMMRNGRTLSLLTVLLLSAPLVAWPAQHSLSDRELEAMAGSKYVSGELPLGDGHYVTDVPRKGYIYLCHPMRGGGGGAQHVGSWIHGKSWNFNQKIAVQGRMMWREAQFSDTLKDSLRVLTGNGLPIGATTGIFPVQPADPAYAYDRNPNHIQQQSLQDTLPVNPTYSDTPYCMGGEAGIMLNGVPLFNGFDAGMRDAAAHEIQDSCNGHPQRSGQYHYHSLSSCIRDVSEQRVIGFALDGFPITGPEVSPGKYLTTDDLDECHGITSEIVLDGKRTMTYHYVMTMDFPYSVSCFRGKPSRTGPADSGRTEESRPPQREGQEHGHMPPPEAVQACNGKTQGAECGFISPRRDKIAGRCDTPPGSGVPACIPDRRP